MNKNFITIYLITILSITYTPTIQPIKLFKPAIDIAKEVDQLFDTFLHHVNNEKIDTLNELIDKTNKFFKNHGADIIEYENELARTYESWFKPWHWTKRKKLAHKQLNTLFSFFICHTINPTDNESKISSLAKKTYGQQTDYPHLHLEDRMYKYIKFAKKDYFLKSMGLKHEFRSSLIHKLQQVYRNLFSHQEYINEKRAFRQEQQLDQLKNKLDYLIAKDEKQEKEKEKEIKAVEKTILYY